MRALLLFVFLIPLNCLGECFFVGKANGQKIVLDPLGPPNEYGLSRSQIYGYCARNKIHDYVQNHSLSCSARKGGRQVNYYETKAIQYPKNYEEGLSGTTYVCMSGCDGNAVRKFMQVCEPD